MTLTFTKGDAKMIEAARAEAVTDADFIGMDGDGIQAPGALLIRECKGGAHKYVVHYANTQNGGFHGGEYTDDILEARGWLIARFMRYDPTGDLHKSFKGEL